MDLTNFRKYRAPVVLTAAFALGVASNPLRAGPEYPAHYGEAPVSFDAIAIPGGEFNVSDRKPGVLDKYMFFDARPFQVDVTLPNNRYVGDVAKAVAAGTLSKTAKIYIPAYDVDAHTYPYGDCDGDYVADQLYPETNEVYLNGELLGVLEGNDSIWKFNDGFEVPIEKLNFPAQPGSTATNRIQIAIDVQNKNAVLSSGAIGCRVWATSIDWVGIKFDAADPMYFLTGLFGQPGSFQNSRYQEKIESELGLYSKIIGHDPVTGSKQCVPGALLAVTEHADNFLSEVADDSINTGTAELNAVGHSMGGLDGRMAAYLLGFKEYLGQVGTMDGSPIRHPVRIKSLITHGSPHKGSVVADYVGLTKANNYAADGCDLQTATWDTANQFIQAPTTKLATIGADADVNGDLIIDAAEAAGNQIPPEFKSMDLTWASTFLYEQLYTYDSINWGVEVINVFGQEIEIPWVERIAGGPNPNDTFVSQESANGAPGTLSQTNIDGKNHGTIIDDEIQNRAISVGKTTLGWGEL